MPKYQVKINLEARTTNEDGTERTPKDPTLKEIEAAAIVGLAATYGSDFEVNVFDGERTDID